MSTQTKMNADYLWVRHAPIQQGFKYKNFGHYFLYERAPNRVQRLQMVYRSMGKTYDWELQKFRLSRKIVDKGNKRRFLRNFPRFIKHPLAYLAWATQGWYAASTPRVLICLIAVAFGSALFEWRKHSNIISQHDKFLLASGKNIEGMSGRYVGYHNTNPLRGPSMLDGLFRNPLTPDQVIVNPTWRQNIRKEIQLTNSNGVSFV